MCITLTLEELELFLAFLSIRDKESKTNLEELVLIEEAIEAALTIISLHLVVGGKMWEL